MIRERPILFSGSMVCAILSGAKTQTRRILTPQPDRVENGRPWTTKPGARSYGQPGDRLWVRETWALEDLDEGQRLVFRADRAATWLEEGPLFYLPSDYEPAKWRPSIFMPRDLCRTILEIEAVRVERLQDITEADARAEGVEITPPRLVGGALASMSHRENFAALWYDIHGAMGPRAWTANPWVWVVSFKRVRP